MSNGKRRKTGKRKSKLNASLDGTSELHHAFTMINPIIINDDESDFTDPSKQWSRSEVNALFKPFLNGIRDDVNQMIRCNIGVHDFTRKGEYSSGWTLKKNKNGTYENMIIKYADQSNIEAFNVTKVTSTLAAGILASYQPRKVIWDALVKLGMDASYKKVSKEVLSNGYRKPKKTLVDNVRSAGVEPRIPFLDEGKYVMSKTAVQTGDMTITMDGIILTHVAIGNRRVNIFYPYHDLLSVYPFAYKLTRPTFYYNEHGYLAADFTAVDCYLTPRVKTTNSIIGVDFGSDGNNPFMAVRVFKDGRVSRPMSVSAFTEKLIKRRTALITEKKTLHHRIKRNEANTGNHHEERLNHLREQYDQVKARVNRLTKVINHRMVLDLLSYAQPGEVIAVENLTMFTGSTDYRHGSFYEALVQAAVQRGVVVMRVNPRNTSQDCPSCNGSECLRDLKTSSLSTHEYRARECRECHVVNDRDVLAACMIAKRAFDTLTGDSPVTSLPSVSLTVRNQHGKNHTTPRRPRSRSFRRVTRRSLGTGSCTVNPGGTPHHVVKRPVKLLFALNHHDVKPSVAYSLVSGLTTLDYTTCYLCSTV